MKKNTHGGKRIGVGRKTKEVSGRGKVLSLRVSETTIEKFRQQTKELGLSQGDYLKKLLDLQDTKG